MIVEEKFAQFVSLCEGKPSKVLLLRNFPFLWSPTISSPFHMTLSFSGSLTSSHGTANLQKGSCVQIRPVFYSKLRTHSRKLQENVNKAITSVIFWWEIENPIFLSCYEEKSFLQLSRNSRKALNTTSIFYNVTGLLEFYFQGVKAKGLATISWKKKS